MRLKRLLILRTRFCRDKILNKTYRISYKVPYKNDNTRQGYNKPLEENLQTYLNYDKNTPAKLGVRTLTRTAIFSGLYDRIFSVRGESCYKTVLLNL